MSRGLAGLMLACALPFLLLAVWARFTAVGAWELQLMLAVALPAGPYGDVVRVINFLGELWVWAILIFALSGMLLVARRTWAALLVALTIAGDLAGFAVKLLVERARPEGVIIEHFFGGESFAFPSGHVLRATALAAALLWLLAPAGYRLPTAIAGGAAAGLAMGYARIALGVHWPSDAIGGMLLGLAWFGLTAALLEKLGQRERA